MNKATIGLLMLLGMAVVAAALPRTAAAKFCTDEPCAGGGVDTVCCNDPGEGTPSTSSICGEVSVPGVGDIIGGCTDTSGPSGCIPAVLGDCAAEAAMACDSCGCASHSGCH